MTKGERKLRAKIEAIFQEQLEIEMGIRNLAIIAVKDIYESKNIDNAQCLLDISPPRWKQPIARWLEYAGAEITGLEDKPRVVGLAESGSYSKLNRAKRKSLFDFLSDGRFGLSRREENGEEKGQSVWTI